MFGAVDCTTQQGICKAHDVTGYPTFKYFNYNKNPQKYMGGREVGMLCVDKKLTAYRVQSKETALSKRKINGNESEKGM